MRLFLGVELDEVVRANAAEASRLLRDRIERSAGRVSARWIPAEAMHITLWFIGEVGDDQVDALRQSVSARPFETPSFDLEMSGFGAFPPAGPPRIFWIGVRRGAAEMSRLYGEVAARLAALGFEPEPRPYAAHLTIARIRESPRGSARSIRAALAEMPAECGRSRVAAVTLFRSRLSPRGADYEPLLRVPLS